MRERASGMYPPPPANLVVPCSPFKMSAQPSKEDALLRQLLQDIVDFISSLEAPILRVFLQDLDAEVHSLSVDDVIKKERIIEKAAELRFLPYEAEKEEEDCTSDKGPVWKPTLTNDPSEAYDDDDICGDNAHDEGTSSGGKSEETSTQSAPSAHMELVYTTPKLDSESLDFKYVLMMGDKIGALSERAGAMSMFKTLQMKAIIYELHLCLYKDEQSCHKIVPLIGAEVNFNTKKDTRFSIVTAKNKVFEFKAKTRADREEWREAIEMAATGKKPVKEEEEELIYGDSEDYEFDDYGDGDVAEEMPLYDIPSDEEPETTSTSAYGAQNTSGNGGIHPNDVLLPVNIPEYEPTEPFSDQPEIPEYVESEDPFNDEPHYKTPNNEFNRRVDSLDKDFPMNPPPPRPSATPPPPPPPPKVKPKGTRPAPPPLSSTIAVPLPGAKPAKAEPMPPKQPPAAVSPPKTPSSNLGNFDQELQKALTLRKVSLTKQASVVDKVAERMAEKAAEGMTVAKARPKVPQQETDFQAAMRRRKEMAERKQQEDQTVCNVNTIIPKSTAQCQKVDQPPARRQPAAAAGSSWRAQLKHVELGSRPVVGGQPGTGVGGQVRPQLPRKPQSLGVQPRPAGAIPFVVGGTANSVDGTRYPALGGFRNPAVKVGGFKAATLAGVKPIKPPRPPHITLNAANLAAFQKKLELTEWQKPKHSGKDANEPEDEDSDWSD